MAVSFGELSDGPCTDDLADSSVDASIGAHECEAISPRTEKAMVATTLRPSPFDLSE